MAQTPAGMTDERLAFIRKMSTPNITIENLEADWRQQCTFVHELLAEITRLQTALVAAMAERDEARKEALNAECHKSELRMRAEAAEFQLAQARRGALSWGKPVDFAALRCAGCGNAFMPSGGSYSAVNSGGDWYHSTSCVELRALRALQPGAQP